MTNENDKNGRIAKAEKALAEAQQENILSKIEATMTRDELARKLDTALTITKVIQELGSELENTVAKLRKTLEGGR